MKQTVLGLSGGVDSAVAAALLLENGFAVTGVYLDTGCGSPAGAAEVAAALGIPFQSIDIRDALEKHVIAPFAEEYRRGRTPNPCVLCNPAVKFAALMAAAEEIAPDCTVATGHYVCMSTYEGRPALAVRDGGKDQSYMLCRLPGHWLPRLQFPLGEMENKEQVREKARALGLTAADAPDSQDVCFIPDGDYAAFLEARGVSTAPGSFVDENGRVLGQHKGVHHYTVGQRRGLGVAAGSRIYVSRICPETRTVVLSQGDGMLCRRFPVTEPVWQQPVTLTAGKPLRCGVKIRYRAPIADCTVEALPDGRLLVTTDAPVRAPAPGQTAAFYDGRVLLGGGFLAAEEIAEN